MNGSRTFNLKLKKLQGFHLANEYLFWDLDQYMPNILMTYTSFFISLPGSHSGIGNI